MAGLADELERERRVEERRVRRQRVRTAWDAFGRFPQPGDTTLYGNPPFGRIGDEERCGLISPRAEVWPEANTDYCLQAVEVWQRAIEETRREGSLDLLTVSVPPSTQQRAMHSITLSLAEGEASAVAATTFAELRKTCEPSKDELQPRAGGHVVVFGRRFRLEPEYVSWVQAELKRLWNSESTATQTPPVSAAGPLRESLGDSTAVGIGSGEIDRVDAQDEEVFVTREQVARVRNISEDSLRQRIARAKEAWPAVEYSQPKGEKRKRAGWWLSSIAGSELLTPEMLSELKRVPRAPG